MFEHSALWRGRLSYFVVVAIIIIIIIIIIINVIIIITIIRHKCYKSKEDMLFSYVFQTRGGAMV
jgi:hypothetical protein